ncbi:TIGR03985 family CRISPR-associated protein, partial [Alkalinema pantanalense CENA528]|uniref:TIGR03985 family CRISPR-associated protein n=1 Tax=Alkalinema pantanalense TaxID=1620705 RepID=UPI003D6E6FD5
MFPTFDHPPTIDLLSHLTSGTLNQPNNLAKALRLWTILQTLYSEETDPLPPSFTSAQWRNLHYPNGFPLHTAHTLLKNTPIDLHTWTIDYTHRYPKEAPHLTQRLQEIPFKISDRTLRNDFATLATLGWLHPQGSGNQRQYQRTPINGQQRFILDLENIMSSDLSHQLTHFLQQLHQLWQAPLTSPIRLQYRSARRYQAEFDLITYPVCIYYCQRAPYLFAYGQTPNTPDTLAWYDYRLDHILNITPITWADVPPTWLPKNGSTHPPPPKPPTTPPTHHPTPPHPPPTPPPPPPPPPP